MITRKMERSAQGKSAHAHLYPDKKENNDDFYCPDSGLGRESELGLRCVNEHAY